MTYSERDGEPIARASDSDSIGDRLDALSRPLAERVLKRAIELHHDDVHGPGHTVQTGVVTALRIGDVVREQELRVAKRGMTNCRVGSPVFSEPGANVEGRPVSVGPGPG